MRTPPLSLNRERIRIMKNHIRLTLALVMFFALISQALAADYTEVNQVAEKIVNQLDNAMEKMDLKAYIAPWSDQYKNVTKEQFETLCKAAKENLGNLVSKKYYNTNEYKGYYVVQWEARYEKINTPLYIRLVLGKVDGKYKVFGHWVKQLPLEKELEEIKKMKESQEKTETK